MLLRLLTSSLLQISRLCLTFADILRRLRQRSARHAQKRCRRAVTQSKTYRSATASFLTFQTVESWLLPSPPSQSGRVIIKHVKNAAVFVYNAALLSRTCHHNATLTQSFDRTLRLRFGQSHHLLQVSRVDNRLCNQIRQYTPNGGIGTHTAQIRTRFIQLFA